MSVLHLNSEVLFSFPRYLDILQFAISCPRCFKHLCFPCTAGSIRCTCEASDNSTTTIITAVADSRCPPAILEQWAHVRAGKLRASDSSHSHASLRSDDVPATTASLSSVLEECTSSPSSPLLHRALGGLSGEIDAELYRCRGVSSAFCISTQRSHFALASSSAASPAEHCSIVRSSLASWWTPVPVAIASPPDSIATSCTALPAAFGDTIVHEPSFAFAPRQSPLQAPFSESSPAPASGVPAVGRTGDAGSLGGAFLKRATSSFGFGDNSRASFAAHADSRGHLLSTSHTRDHYQPPRFKRHRLHRDRAPTESQSRAFSEASRSSASSGSLHLTLLDDDGIETVFRMGTSASFEQVAVAYAGLVGAQPHRVQLWHSGALIHHSRTPAQV